MGAIGKAVRQARMDLERREVTAPDWGGATLYAKPLASQPFSLLMKKHGLENMHTPAYMLDAMEMISETKDGKRALDKQDRMDLDLADPVVIARVYGALAKTISTEEAEKN